MALLIALISDQANSWRRSIVLGGSGNVLESVGFKNSQMTFSTGLDRALIYSQFVSGSKTLTVDSDHGVFLNALTTDAIYGANFYDGVGSSVGNDAVFFNDSSGADTVTGGKSQAAINWSASHFARVTNYDSVTAARTKGTRPILRLHYGIGSSG